MPEPMPVPEQTQHQAPEGPVGVSDERPSDSSLGDFWYRAVLQLVEAEAVSALVRELALQSTLVSRSDALWRLQVANASLAQAGVRERLQAALQGAGYAVRLELEVAPVADSPAKRLAQAAAQRLREAEDTVLGDPFVQALLRDFGGKIVPGSIEPI